MDILLQQPPVRKVKIVCTPAHSTFVGKTVVHGTARELYLLFTGGCCVETAHLLLRCKEITRYYKFHKSEGRTYHCAHIIKPRASRTLSGSSKHPFSPDQIALALILRSSHSLSTATPLATRTAWYQRAREIPRLPEFLTFTMNSGRRKCPSLFRTVQGLCSTSIQWSLQLRTPHHILRHSVR